jgi:hypothetical protein
MPEVELQLTQDLLDLRVRYGDDATARRLRAGAPRQRGKGACSSA